MNWLDVRTVIFSHLLTDVLGALVVALLWQQNRKRFTGTSFWVLDFAFQAAATLLIILRGSVPDWMSTVLANTLVIAGALAGYMGLERFVGKIGAQVHNYVLLAVFAGVHTYFFFVQPNLAARNLNVSLGLLILCFQCAWLMVRRVAPGMRQITRGVGLVFGAFCLVSLIRIGVTLASPQPNNDFFQSGTFDTLSLMSYQMLLILLAYGLTLMVNERLLMEVRLQEEKFSKAFRSSPYAITFTRLPDGQILEVNEGFVNLTGYQYAEVIGKTTQDLRLWAREEDRAAAIAELSQDNKVHGKEYQFRIKSGELITGLFSAEIVTINDQPWVLSSINNITERKQMEEKLKALSIHDTLTGLYNRRFFEEEMTRLGRGRQFPVSVVMADLNNLKETNDRDGHAAGDALLQRAAQVLQAAFRADDIIARIGGDEFAVLLPDTDAGSAQQSLHRVRRALDEHNAAHGGTRLSIAFGVSTAEKGVPLTDALKEADAQMYEEKRGR